MVAHPPYALILAGGAGTRFWPASRKDHPKQLLPLAGAEPLLRQTAERLLPVCPWDRIYVSTGAHLLGPSRQVLPELEPHQWLVEPVGRNTAPCIGWAAATIARQAPESVVIALPADHHIGDVPAFHRCLRRAVAAAETGVITTVGIRPTRPEVGYGYIEAAAPAALEGVWQVRRFVEKPDHERATAYLAAGNYYWNSGMFMFRARDMVTAITAHLPELARGLDELDRAAERGEEAATLAQVFPVLPAISIDYGVMEHQRDLYVVPGDFRWSDVGSWLAAAELAEPDGRGNATPPDAVLVDADDNYVVDLRTSSAAGLAKPIIALVGVRGLVVVETDDALLVCERSQAQRVKQVVEELGRRGDVGRL